MALLLLLLDDRRSDESSDDEGKIIRDDDMSIFRSEGVATPSHSPHSTEAISRFLEFQLRWCSMALCPFVRVMMMNPE